MFFRVLMSISPFGTIVSIITSNVFVLLNSPEKSLQKRYKSIAAKNQESNTDPIRILIYNGDTDPGLNSFLGEKWTSELGLEETESWRPWTRDGKVKMGGYVTSYEGDFSYATIRGSGHMVPEYKPESAFVMLKSFIAFL